MAEFLNQHLGEYLGTFLFIVGKILLFVIPVAVSMAFLTLAERKIIGAMQL